MKIAIFDLDGTLCNNNHRLHLIKRDEPDWNEYDQQAKDDTPNQSIVDLCNITYNSGVKIAILSGRSCIIREETEDWLKKYGVKYNILLMRAVDDHRKSSNIKKEFVYKSLCSFNANFDQILFSVDDCSSVVKMWRSLGITCLQCAEGDF